MKLHIVYGHSEIFKAVNDGNALEYAQKQVDCIKGTDQELQVNVGNSVAILAFRILVLRGVISPDEIAFYEAKHPITSNNIIDKSTFDRPFNVDLNGKFYSPTPDFSSVLNEFLKEIVFK